MTVELFMTLLVFALVSSITPGPNNFMLLASGVNFGFQRTIPHMLGIGGGFFILLLAIGFGLGRLFLQFPTLQLSLKIVGGLYLLYLAYKIALSRNLGDGQVTEKNQKKPMSFLAAAAFQWVNPKAWMMAIVAMTTYTNPQAHTQTVWLVAIAFALVNVPSVSTWAGFGTALRHWLSDPVRLKWFNITMGVLLVLTLWPMLR